MKKNMFLFCFIFFSISYSQQEINYVYNVELIDKNYAPKFISKNGILIYDGIDNSEKDFFNKYTLSEFYSTYPDYKTERLKNMFTLVTKDSMLIEDLFKKFPNKYLRYENLTGVRIELSYYPNDYGTTSPVSNLGANLSLKSYDYVNVPKAWEYFSPENIGNIEIGISDGKINDSDIDFSGKTSFISINSFSTQFSCGSASWHGTSVAAVAAARGNNSHGITGVCPDCDIVNSPYHIESNRNITPHFSNLMTMANSGVRVINMSWYMIGPLANPLPNGPQTCGDCTDPTYQDGYIESVQIAINELHSMGVVLVAAAGNNNSYENGSGYPHYMLYQYPASYENVISVSVVQAKNKNFADELTTGPYGVASWYNEDLISLTGSYIDSVFTSYNAGRTTNSRVDICGPGYTPVYASYLLNCQVDGNPSFYASHTSMSAPFVSATAALMISLNYCLNPDEVEDILQLSSKNIESNPHNSYYIGQLGSGKLETGDAVEFTYESMIPNGNAVIDNQDFWRFNFDLSRISNNLTISNLTLRETNTSTFKAKNSIDVIENSDFNPTTGFVDLSVDSGIDICSASQRVSKNKSKKEENDYDLIKRNFDKKVHLYPNPNEGDFRLVFNGKISEEIEVTIFDIYGKLVYSLSSKESEIDFKLNNLNSGVYFVKVSSSEINESIKFIKR